MGLRQALSADDALARIFAMGGAGDITRVWIGGDLVKGG